jgi:hypothetical protein
MKPLIVIKKNDSISGIDTASIQSVSSELCTIVGIMNLPDEANYNFQKFFKILLQSNIQLFSTGMENSSRIDIN